MAELTNNRWIANDNEFATRVEISDLDGFFYKNLTIEPGVRALILERGQSVGEVPPGQYTLQGLSDKLKFWTKKSITAILTRLGEVPLELECSGLPTSELIEVEVAVRLCVQIDDVALFQKNLLASRSALTLADLRNIVLPIVRQALWETISRLSIKDLTGDQARGDLEMCVAQGLGTALIRNGLRFTQVQTLSVSHPEYDAHRRRTGQLWLQRLDLDHDKAAAGLVADRLFAEIQQQEKTDELEVLAQQVAADRMEGDLALRIRRVGIRKKLREAVLAGKFDELNSADELVKFQQQLNQDQSIRQDEFDTLVAVLKEKSADRVATRARLLEKLRIEQQAELEGLRIDLDYAQQVKTRRHEMALAELDDSAASRQWQANLQRESAAAENRHAAALKQLAHDRQIALTERTDRRENEVQDALHGQRMDRVQGEIQIAQAERGQRVELIQVETLKSHEFAKLEIASRKSELERNINRDAGLDQLARLAQVQQMNLSFEREMREMKRTDQKQDAELEVLKEDKVSQRELARIQALRGMSAIELLATSPQAALLADVLKHKSTNQAAVAMAQSQATAAQANDSRLEELRSKLTQSERDGAERAIAALKEAMQSQQATFGQFGSMIESVTKNLAPQPGSTVVVSGGTAVPVHPAGAAPADATGRKVLVCSSCRTENPESNRFCHQCGKGL